MEPDPPGHQDQGGHHRQRPEHQGRHHFVSPLVGGPGQQQRQCSGHRHAGGPAGAGDGPGSSDLRGGHRQHVDRGGRALDGADHRPTPGQSPDRQSGHQRRADRQVAAHREHRHDTRHQTGQRRYDVDHRQVPDVEATPLDREPVGPPGMVDLLAERLDGVERRDPQGETGRHHQGGRPGPHPAKGEARCYRQGQNPNQSGCRPAHDATNPPPQHRPSGRATTSPDPGPAPGSFLGQLSTQDHHRAQVLEGDRELELTDKGRSALGRLQ